MPDELIFDMDAIRAGGIVKEQTPEIEQPVKKDFDDLVSGFMKKPELPPQPQPGQNEQQTTHTQQQQQQNANAGKFNSFAKIIFRLVSGAFGSAVVLKTGKTARELGLGADDTDRALFAEILNDSYKEGNFKPPSPFWMMCLFFIAIYAESIIALIFYDEKKIAPARLELSKTPVTLPIKPYSPARSNGQARAQSLRKDGTAYKRGKHRNTCPRSIDRINGVCNCK